MLRASLVLRKLFPFLKLAEDSNELKQKIYISYGMWKSGSTYAFELAKTMFVKNGYPQPRLSDYAVETGHKINFVRDWSQKQLEAIINEASNNNTIIVIKTHRPPSPEVTKLLEDNLAVGHAVYRDPRDIALSLLDAGNHAREKGYQAFSDINSLDDTVKRIHRQIKIFEQWVNIKNIKSINYQTFTNDPIKLANLISEQTGFLHYNIKDANDVKKSRFIQLNKGKQNRHETEMSLGQKKVFQEHFQDFYKTFF